MKGIDKSEVSRISKQLDEFVEEFKNRRLEGEYPYLWLDATSQGSGGAGYAVWH